MTDEEKREQRRKLNIIREAIQNALNNVDYQIADLCHTFTEQDLLNLGYIKGHFSGPYMAYEYVNGRKTVVFLDKSGDVMSYDGQPTRSFKDIQELIDYTV